MRVIEAGADPEAPTGSAAGPGPARRAGRMPRIGWVGAGIVGFFVFVAVAGPSLAPYPPKALAADGLTSPSWDHPLGTTRIGQDLFSQLIVGARASMIMAFMAGLGAVTLGAAAGLVSGWFGGWIDALIMRLVDVILAFPRLPALILLGAYVGTSQVEVALVISILFWPGPARVVRGQVQSLRRRLHVRASQGFGAGAFRTLRRHILPEVGLILVAALVGAAGRAIILESGLAFLGIGDPSRVSWGSMIREARAMTGIFYTNRWIWWMMPPVVCIIAVMLGMTFLGVGLERRLNPRLARHVGADG